MKRKHHLILLAIITMLSFCGCGKESVERTDPAQDESPATTYTAVDESDAKSETSPVDIPLEVTFQTKKCENYESESVMYFYFKIKNISGSALKSPLIGADLLDSNGNIVYSEGFTHTGLLAPDQTFDGFLSIDSNNEHWDDRDNITSANLVYYMDNDHDLHSFDEPVSIPIT